MKTTGAKNAARTVRTRTSDRSQPVRAAMPEHTPPMTRGCARYHPEFLMASKNPLRRWGC